MANANRTGNMLASINSLSNFWKSPQVEEVVEVRDIEAEENLYQLVLDHLLVDFISLGKPGRARLREFVRTEEVSQLTLKNVTNSLQTILVCHDVNLYDKGEFVEVIVMYDNPQPLVELLTHVEPTDIPVMDPSAFDWYFNKRNQDFDYILKNIFHQLGYYALENDLQFDDLFQVKGSIAIVVDTYINAANLSAIIQHFQFADARQVTITRNNEMTDLDQGSITTLNFNFNYRTNDQVSALTLLQPSAQK
jgi:hypothetical protein